MSLSKNIIFRPIRFLFIGMVYCFVFFGCVKKVIPIQPQKGCVSIPPFKYAGNGYNYKLDGAANTSPHFNPNNPNQIIFTRLPDSVFTYDLSSNVKTFQFKMTTWSAFQWSRKNWLIVALPDANIYKCKPNGDSLTQLTTGGGFFYPVWSYTGSDFITQYNPKSCSIIFSELGVALDTIKPGVIGQDWNAQNNIIGGASSQNSFVYNTSTKIKTNLSIFIGSVAIWINSNELVWSTNDGIFKANITTNQITTLKQTCNSSFYANPTYNAALNKLIWEKHDFTLIDDYNVKFKRHLIIMSPDCSEETEINIP